MNARLLVINPQQTTEPPLAPSLILEEEGKVLLYSGDWVRFIQQGNLEEITQEDLHQPLHLRNTDAVYLSEVRELPEEDLQSETLIAWTQHWWQEMVSKLPLKEPVQIAS